VGVFVPGSGALGYELAPSCPIRSGKSNEFATAMRLTSTAFVRPWSHRQAREETRNQNSPKRREAMTAAEVNLQELALRVRTLERQNRRWKTFSLLALLLVACSITVGVRGQGDISPNLLRAGRVESQDFVLKDATGNVRPCT
jgi:hypothetical protein